MKKSTYILIPISVIFFNLLSSSDTLPKIVGLMPARNESQTIELIVRAFSQYTDAIVVLDDASDDSTVQILEAIAQECHVEKIIKKAVWVRDELGDRNMLLEAGRNIGGTHFIVLDADQMFSADCMQDDWLRKKILSLEPGQIIKFPIINVWGDLDHYRDDELCNPFQNRWMESIVFYDDGQCSYLDNKIWGVSQVIHVQKNPSNLVCKSGQQYLEIHEIDHGVLHFKSVDLDEMACKRLWYMFLEYIKSNEKSSNFVLNAKSINEFYAKSYDGGDRAHSLELARCKTTQFSWYNYPFFVKDIFDVQNSYRKRDIIFWAQKYGLEYFKDLNIWHNPLFISFAKEAGYGDVIDSYITPFPEETAIKKTDHVKTGRVRRRRL